MTQPRIVPFEAVDKPEPGMLYSDRLGPWFDSGGSEMILVGTEAVEARGVPEVDHGHDQ